MLPNSQHMCSVNKHSYSINIFLISNLRSLWSSSPKLFLIWVGNHTTTGNKNKLQISHKKLQMLPNSQHIHSVNKHSYSYKYDDEVKKHLLKHYCWTWNLAEYKKSLLSCGSYMLTSRVCLHAHVRICLACSRVNESCMLPYSCTNVPCVLMCLRANVSRMISCSHANVSYMLTCSYASLSYVLKCLACWRADVATCLTCFCTQVSSCLAFLHPLVFTC